MKRFLLSLLVLISLSAILVHTQDYTFGNITVNGIAPVVASSPGAGIAHFAGGTQTVTSSAVNLASSDVTGVLASGNGGFSATVWFQDLTGFTQANVSGGTTQNQITIMPFYVPYSVTLSNIGYNVQAIDNSANSYDMGLYGPGCLAGAAGISRAAHTGTTAGSTLVPSLASRAQAITGAPVTITPGWYAFAETSNAVNPLASFGGSTSNAITFTPWTAQKITGGGSTLPSTITCPATSFANNPMIFVSLF